MLIYLHYNSVIEYVVFTPVLVYCTWYSYLCRCKYRIINWVCVMLW